MVLLALAVLLSGCATARLHLKTDDGEMFDVQPRSIARVELSDALFEATMASLYARWELPAHSTQRQGQVQPASWGVSWKSPQPLTDSGMASGNQADLARGYGALCARRGEPGDCLGLFDDGAFLTVTDKRAIVTRIAFSEAFIGAAESLRGVSARQVEVAVLAALVVYLGLLAVPEPVSKVVVIVFAANLIASIGVDVFLSFVQGYRELKKEAEAAETFADVREAGERYGRLIGPAGARLAVILVSMGAGGALGAAGGGGLPGATLAANAEAQGFVLAGASVFTSVEVAAAGSSVAFGVGAGMAVAPWVLREKGEEVIDKRPRGFHSFSAFKRARGPAGPGKEWHHIVEKTPGNVERFGAEQIHHDQNMIAVERAVHQKISEHYSSKQFSTENRVARDWLRSRSFEEQREYGLQVLRRYGVIP